MSVHAGSLLKVLTQFLRLSRLTSVTHTLTTSLMNLLIFGGWVSHRRKDLGPPGAYLAVLLILQRRSFQFCDEQLKVHLFWTVVTLMELVVIPSAKTQGATSMCHILKCGAKDVMCPLAESNLIAVSLHAVPMSISIALFSTTQISSL